MNNAEKFYQFETNYDLDKFIIDDFWYYPIVKTAIYFELAGSTSLINNSSSARKLSGARIIFKQLLQGLKWKFKSAKLKSADYLFVDYAIAWRYSGHKLENIYTGPIMDDLSKKEFLLFEYPSSDFGHHSEIQTGNTFFPDWEILKIFLKAGILKKKWIKRHQPLIELFNQFELSYNPIFINDRLTKFFLFADFFRRLLRKMKPKVIILIDGYDYKQMALIYAAKKMAIPTIELQHGFINASHMAYIYSNIKSNQLFSDYLFTFGVYFSNIIRQHSAAWKKEHVIAVGFPYIEKVKNRYPDLPEKLKELAAKYRIIYITSQWTVRDELKSFVLDLSRLLDKKYKIFYKVHPGEKDVENFYGEFHLIKNIELIIDKRINSLEIMKVASIHSTVYSTSFFESMFFELPNIFIFVPQYRAMIEEFIDYETTFLAVNVQSYLKYLAQLENSPNLKPKLQKKRNIFYTPNAFDKTFNEINQVISATKR